MYGAIYKPGTDGYSLPFYRYYDFNNMIPTYIGNEICLVIPVPNHVLVDVLIPYNQIVYRMTITPEKAIKNPVLIPFWKQ